MKCAQIVQLVNEVRGYLCPQSETLFKVSYAHNVYYMPENVTTNSLHMDTS